jgi:CheY-like chemotaxis protein
MARILVIDDDVPVRLVVKRILEREGHVVVLAAHGHDGARAIEAYAFDLAIVDIFMPDMAGLETIKAFHQSAPRLPIIAISGYVFREASEPAPDFLRMAVDLGAMAFLRKPFTPAQLLHAVQACTKPAAGASDPTRGTSRLDYDLGRGAA